MRLTRRDGAHRHPVVVGVVVHDSWFSSVKVTDPVAIGVPEVSVTTAET